MAAQRTGFWFLFKGVDQTGCGPRDETGLLRTLPLKVKLGEVSASHAGELHVGAAQTGSGLWWFWSSAGRQEAVSDGKQLQLVESKREPRTWSGFCPRPLSRFTSSS